MAAHLRYITVDCRDSNTLADFWTAALGWDIVYKKADGALLADPSGVEPKLFLQPVPEPKSGKNRAHIDLETDDFDAEVHRLLELGATVAGANDGTQSAVLADPQGNEFCLLASARPVEVEPQETRDGAERSESPPPTVDVLPTIRRLQENQRRDAA